MTPEQHNTILDRLDNLRHATWVQTRLLAAFFNRFVVPVDPELEAQINKMDKHEDALKVELTKKNVL